MKPREEVERRSPMNLVLKSSWRRLLKTNPGSIHLFSKYRKSHLSKSNKNDSNIWRWEKQMRSGVGGWNTLRETKSTRSSALALKGLALEEIFRQSSFRVDGVWEEAESKEAAELSMDLLKHQFLPLIGNTTNLALMLFPSNPFRLFFFFLFGFTTSTPL